MHMPYMTKAPFAATGDAKQLVTSCEKRGMCGGVKGRGRCRQESGVRTVGPCTAGCDQRSSCIFQDIRMTCAGMHNAVG